MAGEEAADFDVDIEDDGPEEGEAGAANETADGISTEKAGEDDGEKDTRPEGGIEVDDHADGETAGHAFGAGFDSEKSGGVQQGGPLQRSKTC